jgi:hypothetical protein
MLTQSLAEDSTPMTVRRIVAGERLDQTGKVSWASLARHCAAGTLRMGLNMTAIRPY